MKTRSSRPFRKLGQLVLGAGFVLVLSGGCANIIGVSDLEDEDAAVVIGGATSCDGSPLRLNEALLRGCILYESCYSATTSISTCVTFNIPDAFSGRSCAENAATCADIVDCRHSAYLHPGAPASCTDTSNRCLNNVAVNCGFDVPEYTDCNLEGGTCSDISGFALCEVVPSCVEEDFTNGCSGNNSYFCYQGVGYGVDCSTLAATCDPLDGSCYYAQASCGVDSALCVGAVAEECFGGKQTSYDCGAVNLGCTEDNDTTYCLAAGCEPDDWIDCEESCSGSELTLCYGGAEVTVDCRDYGFNTCAESLLEYSDGSTLPIATCAF